MYGVYTLHAVYIYTIYTCIWYMYGMVYMGDLPELVVLLSKILVRHFALLGQILVVKGPLYKHSIAIYTPGK